MFVVKLHCLSLQKYIVRLFSNWLITILSKGEKNVFSSSGNMVKVAVPVQKGDIMELKQIQLSYDVIYIGFEF